jgi:hypothetical protein
MVKSKAKYLPTIQRSEKGKARDITPSNQLTGNNTKRSNGDHLRKITAAIESTKSIVVLTVCLVMPCPDATYLLMPYIQLNAKIEAIIMTIMPKIFIFIFVFNPYFLWLLSIADKEEKKRIAAIKSRTTQMDFVRNTGIIGLNSNAIAPKIIVQEVF